MGEQPNVDICPTPLPPRTAPPGVITRVPPALASPLPSDKYTANVATHSVRKLQVHCFCFFAAAKLIFFLSDEFHLEKLHEWAPF